MNRLLFSAALLLALPASAEEEPEASAAPTAEAAPKPAAESPEAAQLKVWQALMGSATQIDACTQKYTGEFPDRAGSVSITVGIGTDGRVLTVKTDTDLKAPDRLNGCLGSVARGWRFPTHSGEDPATLTLKVEVKKGQKFKLLKPGEKQPAAPATPQGQPAPAEPQFRYAPGWTQE
jgi:hypothetical protein